MKREDFILGDYGYETQFNGILIKVHRDAMDEKTVAYANKILKLYLSKKPEIMDYILNNSVLNFYEGRYTSDEIVEKLKEANIEIISDKWGTLTWLNHDLDEHIIQVEFNEDMQLSYVGIDG